MIIMMRWAALSCSDTVVTVVALRQRAKWIILNDKKLRQRARWIMIKWKKLKVASSKILRQHPYALTDKYTIAEKF